MKRKILVSAIEASSNLHLKELLTYLDNVELYGIFNEELSSYGEPLIQGKDLSAMGFLGVLPLIKKALATMKKMVILAKNVDEVLLMDSSSFNIRLAKAMKKAGIKVRITYYILPQVWAWKPKRVKVVEENCDILASIWPFDENYYRKKRIFVGNPLLDEIPSSRTTLVENKKLAFLPGSRRSEIKNLMPIFRSLVKEFPNYELLLPIPEHLMKEKDELYGDLSAFSVNNDALASLQVSDFAFICSGTATLQSALLGTPFVLAYKTKSIDVFIAKLFVKVKFAGLANIIFDFMGKKQLHLELIQKDLTRENLLEAYKNCDRASFLQAAQDLRLYLKHGSAKNVANILENKIDI